MGFRSFNNFLNRLLLFQHVGEMGKGVSHWSTKLILHGAEQCQLVSGAH